MHHAPLVFVIVTLFIFGVYSPTIKTHFSSVLGSSIAVSAKELLLLTNEKRQETGVGTLVLNNKLSLAAAQKAKHMFQHNYWAHNSPEGVTPWHFIKEEGYEYSYAGENLARGFTISKDVVDAWMESRSHRENMLSENYQDVGFAIEEGRLGEEDTVLVVEMFGGRVVGKESVSLSDPVGSLQNEKQAVLPSVEKQPFLDDYTATKSIGLGVLFLFMSVLTIDLVIVKRKKLVRLVGHNIDHIFYLGTILLFIMFITQGGVL